MNKFHILINHTNRKPKNRRIIDNYLDVINKMLAMLGFVSMAIISDDHFTTWFQSPVEHFKQSLLILDMQNGISAVDYGQIFL